ncbi:hypothetical protein [Glaciecola sp. SC05]|uniref:hypothetical protein n=1 Tax=Glaciecola sp. SC05 TaxID=1987355 RepID=UPI00352870D5
MITLFSKLSVIALAILFLSGCAGYHYASQVELNKPLISASGEALDGTPVTIPDDLLGQPALLIFGYVHKSQFDIDRWLIGLDMTKVEIPIYELPAIKNPFAGWFSDRIDQSMRDGIPRELWRDVITIYDDGDKVQRYTGNLTPKNGRIVLIDAQGNVVHFYDRGFSVAALNELNDKIATL